MATEKWIAGATSWTACFGTEVNSIVTGNAILSSVAISNSALDIFADVSWSLGSITPTGAAYIGLFLYPLNQDGTTYGDGRFGSSAAGPPAQNFWVGSSACVIAAGVQVGMVRGIVLPIGASKLVLYNASGVTLAASANTIKYQTYNRSVA